MNFSFVASRQACERWSAADEARFVRPERFCGESLFSPVSSSACSVRTPRSLCFALLFHAHRTIERIDLHVKMRLGLNTVRSPSLASESNSTGKNAAKAVNRQSYDVLKTHSLRIRRKRGGHAETPNPSYSNLFRTLLHSCNSQLICFHSLVHSFTKTPGVGGHRTPRNRPGCSFPASSTCLLPSAFCFLPCGRVQGDT